MGSTTILKPVINTATINPNPVNQNNTFLISISVSEEEFLIEQTVIYCGMFITGQELEGVI
ncbi:hypothetical protein KQI42_15935 [Tissierella sp. MSJ-40]|uniref:Uncharacterized protein n=1 Tax=Tissierella simiarum TaxID=2841534 RepID=A0ABS6EAE2_9FIRM|nr:hypothetical protein [Tissierella simiarum]MBU5439506.1 hypothetical protein [Tissierella simiarum]